MMCSDRTLTDTYFVRLAHAGVYRFCFFVLKRFSSSMQRYSMATTRINTNFAARKRKQLTVLLTKNVSL